MKYLVRAEYRTDFQQVEPPSIREATVEADDPADAAIRAITRRMVPVEFIRETGILWSPGTYPEPTTELVSESKIGDQNEVILAFGDEDDARTLLLYVRELEPASEPIN
jgi:hypothetical protein